MLYTDIARLTSDNPGGIATLQFVDCDAIATFPAAVDSILTDDIALVADAYWTRWHFTRFTAQFVEKPAGDIALATAIEMSLPKDNPLKNKEMRSMRKHRFVVLLQTFGGEILVMGSKEQGCRFSLDERNLGKNFADGQRFAASFGIVGVDPTLYAFGTTMPASGGSSGGSGGGSGVGYWIIS